jgi:23S rRNA U2552 (ribose-2'-O)-methylase RlmE/FtsJ
VKSQEDKPTVLGVDLLDVPKIKGAGFIKGDMESQETRVKIQEFFQLQEMDTVYLSLWKILCDAAPNFMGDKDCDHMAISVLNEVALVISKNMLKTGGNLLMKTL